MKEKEIENIILDITIQSLQAQLKAVRNLRGKPESKRVKRKGISQIVMIYNILKLEKKPMHINDIILKVNKEYKVKMDRESIVSALTKKVVRGDRFIRPDKNTFALMDDEDD